MNPRELLQSAQAAEREGDLARAGALLEQAARIYESTGQKARAAQMRRHVDRLGASARAGARGVEEPRTVNLNGHSETAGAEPLPGLDRAARRAHADAGGPGARGLVQLLLPALARGGAAGRGTGAGLRLSQLRGARGVAPVRGSRARRRRHAPGRSEVPDAGPTEVTPGPGEGRAGPSESGAAAEAGPGALPTQAEAVRRIESALAAGHARVLLVGAAGSGKSTWLHAWASRGLGTAWDGTEPLPDHGAVLVDDVDRLEPAARRQLARALRNRPVVLALDATLPEPEQEVGGRRVHAPEQVESLAGSWLPGPVLDGLTLECFRAPGEAELRLLAERWRAPDGSVAPPDALEEALRLAVRSARAAHALHALLLRWWASR